MPGQIVEVRLTTTAGTPPLFFMRDSQTGFSRKFRATGLYRFRARSTEHVVNIDTERLR